MTLSQNGWEANDRTLIHDPELDNIGVTFPGGIRKGNVTKLLLHVARRFHGEVEQLVPGWCWGYAERDVRGGTSVSNHASGTAIDFNAPKHPLGAEHTFTRQQIIAIHRIVESTQRVVRWGGDYVNRKDEMHFEINAGPARVKEVVQQLGDDDMPTPEEYADAVWKHIIRDSRVDMKAPAELVVGEMFNNLRRIQAKLHKHDLEALDVNIDPATLADAIVEALPPELASQVVDEASRRLAGNTSQDDS